MGAGYAVSVRLLFSCLIVELKSHSSGIGKETWREHGEKEGKWRRWGKVEKTEISGEVKKWGRSSWKPQG